MKEKKKRKYMVTCQVNMDASRHETVLVTATKPQHALQAAEKALLERGFFYADAVGFVVT